MTVNCVMVAMNVLMEKLKNSCKICSPDTFKRKKNCIKICKGIHYMYS